MIVICDIWNECNWRTKEGYCGRDVVHLAPHCTHIFKSDGSFKYPNGQPAAYPREYVVIEEEENKNDSKSDSSNSSTIDSDTSNETNL